MDRLAEVGSNWTCGALHAAEIFSLEMQACGSNTARFATGLIAIAALSLTAGVAVTYLLVGRSR